VAVLDAHTNDLITNATQLLTQNNNGQDNRFDYYYEASIEDSTDRDTYKIQARAASAGVAENLNVMVWAQGANHLNPIISVFDASGNPIAFSVLANEAGIMSIRLANVTPSAYYYVQVAARVPGSGPTSTGQYAFAADFNSLAATAYDINNAGTVNVNSTNTVTMLIGQSALYQYSLAATALSGGGSVTMSVFDQAGNLVFTMSNMAGQLTVTANTYLAAGVYTLQYTSSGTSSPLSYKMSLLDLSGPMGTYKPNTNSSAPQPQPAPDFESANATKSSDVYWF
jgi:hypothetical protein